MKRWRLNRKTVCAACAAVLILGVMGCGGDEDAPAALDGLELPNAPASAGDEAAQAPATPGLLTEEEAAVLAEFRASRHAGPSKDAGRDREPVSPREAAPGTSGHDEAIASIKGEPAGEVPYDFDRAASPNSVPGSAPAAAAPGPASPNPASTPAAPANTPTVFRQHQVTDPGMNGMVANTVLVPEGWKVEGGITRTGNQLWNMPFLMDVKYTAPDGRQLHFLPSLSFGFNAQAQAQGAQLFQPTGDGNLYYPLPETPGQWIMELSRSNPDPSVKNVRLISEEPEPTLTRQLQQQSAGLYRMVQNNKQLAMQTGVDMAFDTQATVVKIRYTEDGVELEESILVVWQYFLNIWQGQVSGGSWSVPFMMSLRGPVGTDYVNDPQLLTVFQSVQVNPAWQAQMNQYWAELARIRQRGQDQRNRDWQAHNAKMQQIRSETSDIIASGYANRVASQDRTNEKFNDAISDVTTYNTPEGDTVKLPSFYDNVYTDGNDRFILTNDQFYNPDGDLNMSGSWTKIEPQP